MPILKITSTFFAVHAINYPHINFYNTSLRVFVKIAWFKNLLSNLRYTNYLYWASRKWKECEIQFYSIHLMKWACTPYFKKLKLWFECRNRCCKWNDDGLTILYPIFVACVFYLPKLWVAESGGWLGITPICSYFAKFMAATSRLNIWVSCFILLGSHSTSTKISYSDSRFADFLDSIWTTLTPKSCVKVHLLFYIVFKNNFYYLNVFGDTWKTWSALANPPTWFFRENMTEFFMSLVFFLTEWTCCSCVI